MQGEHLGPAGHIHNQKGPKRGETAERTADADTKQKERKAARDPPTPHLGRKGGVDEGGRAVVEPRERPEPLVRAGRYGITSRGL